MTRRLTLLPAFVLLALYLAFMLATNHRLTILDDEANIISTANTPTPQRLNTFLHGTGQHLHPPLSDILLHEWLRLTRHSFALLRAPAILLYIAGLCALARCAQLLGNRAAWWGVLLFGTLWPFGYFYARITGWYCVSFFLIAALTCSFFLLLERASTRRWIVFATLAILLVWSNYFGIAVLLVLLADLLLFRRTFARANLQPLAFTVATILVSFLPLLRDLLATHGTGNLVGESAAANLQTIAYMLYAVLASISVAPWFLPWSAPALAAAAVLYFVLLAEPASRRLAIYFLLLMLGLSATHTLDLKRMLFITPWLILSIALCCSSVSRLKARIALASIAVIFSIGWGGIASGRHRATVNFYEPWKTVAQLTTEDAKPGTAIVTDSGLYLFYLNNTLGLLDIPSASPYLGPAAYRQRDLSVFVYRLPSGIDPASFSNVITVRGPNTPTDMEIMAVTFAQLQQSCRLTASERFAPDPAAQYKQRLDPATPIMVYRVLIDHFDCSSGHSNN